MKRRIFFRLMSAFLLVIMASMATLDFKIRRDWDRSLRSEIQKGLVQKTKLFAQRVEAADSAGLPQIARNEALAANTRATIIDSSGRVLADSEADPASMENHAGRPEFAAALRGGVGVSTRFSHTLGVDFLYVAVPVPGGAVRLADPLSAIQQTTAQIRRTLLEASAWALLVALLLAGWAAYAISGRLRSIVRFAERISSGDLSARMQDHFSDEIGQVAAALDRTARQLERSFGELENSRSELETLLNSLQDAVIAVSAEGTVQWANASMARLLAHDVRLSRPLLETSRNPELNKCIGESLESREVRAARLTLGIPARTFDLTAAPLPGGGAVAVLHDQTKTERIEKTRRDFIANVSHELRTPLTSITGYAETLLDLLSPDERSREFAEIIRKNASRMSRLTEDLLTLARVESGEHRLMIKDSPAETLLEDAVETFRDVARARGLELVIEHKAARKVRADPDAVHQVFANLIDNAIKYAPAGSRILLGAREAGGFLEFYVRDFGPGISSEHLPRLFERFYRVDTARSREAGGTGLGLAIVKHIVLNHGGTVRAESVLNRGSTFFFTLPLAATEAAAKVLGDACR